MDDLDIVASLAKLNELIEGIPTAVISSVGGVEQRHRRPMFVLGVKADDYLWFATPETFSISDDLREDARLSVRFTDEHRRRTIVAHGTAAVVHAQHIIDELWVPAMLGWFPGGTTDRNLVLVRLSVSSAAYWEITGGPFHYLRLADATPSVGRDAGAAPPDPLAIDQASKRA